MEKSGQNDLPQMATDYIDAVIRKMRYRKKVRAEVRQELTDHFTDALADCKSEEERNAIAKELIAGFGDAKLLGVLLRRGKKRCRPLWRTMVARAFQAVGILFLLLLLYIGWFFSGKPIVTTNYVEQMNKIVRPAVDDTQNAWPYYKQAAEKFESIQDEKFDSSPRPFSKLSEEDRTKILQLIEKQKESIDLIRQGNQKPYYWQSYVNADAERTEMISLLLPNLAGYKKLSALLCWQALLYAEKGDIAAAFDNTLEVYSFGRHLRGQNTTLIEQLVAMSIEGLSAETLRTLLSEHLRSIDAALLSLFQRRFEELISKGTFVVSFESEKLFMYDELQRCFTKSRFGKSHLYLQRLGELQVFAHSDLSNYDVFLVLLSRPEILFTHPDKDETLKMVNLLFDRMSQSAAKTPASVQKKGDDIGKQIEELSHKNLFIGVLMPALEKVVHLSYRSQAGSYATLTIVAILQYYKTHNAYPDSLDALVQSGLLQKLPVDPFSDKPLVYKKTTEEFTLYSVGSNFTDDGGASGTDKDGKPREFGENGDWVFWPVSKEE